MRERSCWQFWDQAIRHLVEFRVQALDTAGVHGHSFRGKDAEFAVINNIADLQVDLRLASSANLDRSVIAIWHPVAGFESTALHGLSVADHIVKSRDLLKQGYRLASLSTHSAHAGAPLTTASVWHRPLVPEDAKEMLAKRQANAACALCRLGRSDQVWPQFQHRPRPAERSYSIHALGPPLTQVN